MCVCLCVCVCIHRCVSHQIPISFAGMSQINFNDGVTVTAVVVYELRHPDVAVSEPAGVVEGGDGAEFSRL